MGLRTQTRLGFAGTPIRDAYFLTVLNRDYFEDIVFWSRLVTFLFGLGLGFVLFSVFRESSTVFVLTLLTLWAFEPSFLAYSGFALSDMPVTFFFFATVWRFEKTLKGSSLGSSLLTGLLAGMAITTKFTALILLPVLVVLEVQSAWADPGRFSWMTLGRRWAVGILGALVWIGLLYLPGTLALSGHPWPWVLFMDGLRDVSRSFSHFYYFRGGLSSSNHWDYYPVTFLLKSPIGFLVLFFTGLALMLAGRKRIPIWQVAPIPFFFLAFLFFHDVGLRMILPIYPFCLLVAAQAGQWMTGEDRPKLTLWTLIWAGLLVFQVYSVGSRFPAQVSYFNELIQPDQRLYWLGDSNLDIGQDTKRLAEAAKTRGWRHVKLAYFGTDDPKLYGMDWSYWTQEDLKGPQSGWFYAVNDEFLQMGPAYTPAAALIGKSWIANRPPDGTVGDTWRYYEIPGPLLKDSSPAIASAPFFIDQRTVLTK